MAKAKRIFASKENAMGHIGLKPQTAREKMTVMTYKAIIIAPVVLILLGKTEGHIGHIAIGQVDCNANPNLISAFI